jgi:dimethylglycine dehydrogenase
MQSHARVVVVGGGVVGCSILYHLTEAGWTDAVLLEQYELTSGSTWHAAGLLPLFNMSYAGGLLHRYSIDLYSRLSAEWDRDVGLRRVGNPRADGGIPDLRDHGRKHRHAARMVDA